MGQERKGRTSRLRKEQKVKKSNGDYSYLPQLHKYLANYKWLNETHLTPRDFSITGRGICSKQNRIYEGSILIRLPIDCLITINTMENDEEFKSKFNSNISGDKEKITFHSLIAFYILYHMKANKQSPLKGYLTSLPKNFTTPFFCQLAELQCLPESILLRIVEQRRLINEAYQALKAIYNTDDHFDQLYPLEDYRWSYFVVNTRSVYITADQLIATDCFFHPFISDNCNLALAPFLDLFNHSDEVNTKANLEYNLHEKRYEYIVRLIQSPQPFIGKYQQIFINYGALSNSKLLLEYGFILRNNQQNLLEINLNDIENFIKQEPTYKRHTFHSNKFKFIRDHNLNEQLFVHHKDGISHNLHVVLHLLFKENNYYTNNLNRIAFGSIDSLRNVDDEVKLLLKFKSKEFEYYIRLLQLLPQRTVSGEQILNYLRECLDYLLNCLVNFN